MSRVDMTFEQHAAVFCLRFNLIMPEASRNVVNLAGFRISLASAHREDGFSLSRLLSFCFLSQQRRMSRRPQEVAQV